MVPKRRAVNPKKASPKKAGAGASRDEEWVPSRMGEVELERLVEAGVLPDHVTAGWQPANDETVYQVLWKNFLAGQWIRHSDWGTQWKKRLFNKSIVHWDDAIAHEDITSDRPLQFVKLDGYLEHYSFKDTREYAMKMIHSAMITAQKYHQQNKRAGIKLFVSPIFSFIKSYIIKLGFLDGYNGWLIAVTNAYYTFIKYARLNELNRK